MIYFNYLNIPLNFKLNKIYIPMKLFKRLSFAFAVMFLMASCELTQAPLEFDKNPNPPMDYVEQGDETSKPHGGTGPPA